VRCAKLARRSRSLLAGPIQFGLEIRPRPRAVRGADFLSTCAGARKLQSKALSAWICSSAISSSHWGFDAARREAPHGEVRSLRSHDKRGEGLNVCSCVKGALHVPRRDDSSKLRWARWYIHLCRIQPLKRPGKEGLCCPEFLTLPTLIAFTSCPRCSCPGCSAPW
jgi:hypothetical protein